VEGEDRGGQTWDQSGDAVEGGWGVVKGEVEGGGQGEEEEGGVGGEGEGVVGG